MHRNLQPNSSDKEGSLLKEVSRKIGNFGDESVLHGVGNVCSASYIPAVKRLFWLVMLIACAIGAANILRAALNVFSQSQVSYSVETTYLDWDTPFPAVTVCESEKNDADVKKILVKNQIKTSLVKFYKDVTFWNYKFCKTCTNCVLNNTCLEDVAEAVEAFRMKCADLLKNCSLGGKPFTCCYRFLPVVTEYNLCYAFNSKLSGNNSQLLYVNRKDGLPDLFFTISTSVMLRIHQQADIVSVASENILFADSKIPLISSVEVMLKAVQTVSDSSVMSSPPATRGCLMRWERPDYARHWPFKLYTYGACQWYCRLMTQVNLCNCTHHFSPKIDGVLTCNLEGLACLNANWEGVAKATCSCPMECDEVTYKAVHVYNRRLSPKGNLTNTQGRVRFIQLPDMRVRRQAIRDLMSLVVDIGGVGGVFFGASVLSVLQIIYLLWIRRD